MMTRRGVTLIELLIAMTMAAILGSLVVSSTATVTAVLRGQVERVGAVVASRSIWGVMRFEWATLGSDSVAGPDVVALAPTAIDYRADRGLMAICRLVPDTVVIAPGRLWRWVARRPVVGRDSLLIYAAGDSAGAVDGWIPIPLIAGPVVAGCPSGEPGERFLTALDSATIARWRLRSPGVARLVEVLRARSYGGGGLWQFGVEGLSAGASVQPVASNLSGPDGLTLMGWGCDGLPGPLGSLCGVDAIVRTTTKRDLGLGGGRAAAVRDSHLVAVRFENRP